MPNPKENKQADVIENYLKYGVDLYHRRIYFGDADWVDGDEVNFSSISYAVRAIDKMLDISNRPIEIHMSSYGGDPYAMLALHDKIKESPCKFIFYGSGFIMSAATWIMAVCDERWLSNNTTIMVHDGSIHIGGRVTDVRISNEEDARLQEVLEEIYAENSHMPKEFWTTVCRRDLYLTADEAVTLGLADAVIGYRKRGNFRKGPRTSTFDNPPQKRQLRSLVAKLYGRIKLDVPKTLNIEVKKEEFEEIAEYDNTTEEMQKLGMKTPESTKEE